MFSTVHDDITVNLPISEYPEAIYFEEIANFPLLTFLDELLETLFKHIG